MTNLYTKPYWLETYVFIFTQKKNLGFVVSFTKFVILPGILKTHSFKLHDLRFSSN